MEFCKDCKHFLQREVRVDYDTNIDFEKQVDRCNSPNLPLDPVWGIRYPIRAKDCRLDGYYCGKDAKWFEFMETEDLDDLSTIPFGRQA
jgi:hypothetical protein